MPAVRSSQARVLFLVAILTIVWGSTWVLFPLAVEEVSIWTFRAICLLAAGALVLLAARLRGLSLFVPRQERKPLVAAGLTYLVVWNMASTYSAVLLPSGQAAVLGFTMPIWATVVSSISCGIGHRRDCCRRRTGRLRRGPARICGSFRLLFRAARIRRRPFSRTGMGGRNTDIQARPADRAAHRVDGMAAACRRSSDRHRCPVSGTWEPFVPSWTTMLAIGYIIVMPMALGNVAWFSIASILPASVSGLSMVMVPIVAMLTGAIIRGEPLGPLEIASMLCCAAAMALVL